MGVTQGTTELKEEVRGDILVLRIRGRLDAQSSSTTEKKLFDEINKGRQKLLIDLSDVAYLSSAGIRMLFSTSKKLHSLGGKMAVCNMSQNVLDVLKMAGFDHVLELHKSEEEALKHL